MPLKPPLPSLVFYLKYDIIMEAHLNQKETIMSIIGIVIMWAWFIAVFAILSKWHTGEEYDRRRAYWAKFEGK